jgi:hypothetical protein
MGWAFRKYDIQAAPCVVKQGMAANLRARGLEGQDGDDLFFAAHHAGKQDNITVDRGAE